MFSLDIETFSYYISQHIDLPLATAASVCFIKNLYKDIPNILHFTLCCFTKAPLEATAETIGSIINQHGRKDRYSLLPSSLSNEVQVAWNGPAEFDPVTDDILKEALELHFKETKTGVRFYTKSVIRYMSNTLTNYYKTPSRICFSTTK